MKKKVEADVVMLPTEKANGVIISDVGPYDSDIIAATKEGIKDLNGERPLNHLYVTVKIKKLDDIKEGDWFTVRANSNAPFYDKLFKCTGTDIKDFGLVQTKGESFGKNLCQKVVATTDSTLGLPSIRQQFVKAFIKTQGKIKKITIEINTIAKIKEDYNIIYKGLELKIIGIYMTYRNGNGHPHFPDGTREFDLSLQGTEFEGRNGHNFTVITETHFEWMKEFVKTRKDGSIFIHKSRTFSEQDMLDFARFAKGERHPDLKLEEFLKERL